MKRFHFAPGTIDIARRNQRAGLRRMALVVLCMALVAVIYIAVAGGPL